MSPIAKLLTPTDLMAAATSVLDSGGYRTVREGFQDWNSPTTRLFEDEYNIVGVTVFSTCAELLGSWADRQGSLVDVISQKVGQSEGKAWDGYLVLLTTGMAPSGDSDIEGVRYDTGRLRKLVATGEELAGFGDVERTLRPLLPIHLGEGSVGRDSVLDLLPGLLEEAGIDGELTRSLVQAFADQKPLMEAFSKTEASR